MGSVSSLDGKTILKLFVCHPFWKPCLMDIREEQWCTITRRIRLGEHSHQCLRCLRPVHYDVVRLFVPSTCCNVLSSSTISFYSHPRPLLPKPTSSRPPLFLLVHKWQPSPSLNQRNRIHWNIWHIITPLQVLQRQIPIVVCKARTCAIVEINSNLKYTRISDNGMFGNAVDREYAWGIVWWGVWRDCWTDRCWSKECGLYSIPLFLFIPFQPFFRRGFLIWYGYKEVITREDSFDIVWFDRDSYKTLRITSEFFSYGPAWSCLIYIFENSEFYL